MDDNHQLGAYFDRMFVEALGSMAVDDWQLQMSNTPSCRVTYSDNPQGLLLDRPSG